MALYALSQLYLIPWHTETAVFYIKTDSARMISAMLVAHFSQLVSVINGEAVIRVVSRSS